MSTTIIYNPRLGERESWTSRIRRSRKRPLGGAASLPPSRVGLKTGRRRCGCVVAAAAARIFSSATGQKPCTIRAQRHRPPRLHELKRGGRPRRAIRVQRLPPLSLSLALSPHPSLFFFFLLLSSLDPHRGRKPTRSRSGGGLFPRRSFGEGRKKAERLSGSPAFSHQSGRREGCGGVVS